MISCQVSRNIGLKKELASSNWRCSLSFEKNEIRFISFYELGPVLSGLVYYVCGWTTVEANKS